MPTLSLTSEKRHLMMSYRGFGSPSRYIQGQDAIQTLAKHLKDFLGENMPIFIIIDALIEQKMGGMIQKLFHSEKMEAERCVFGGECCPEEIERLRQKAHDFKSRVIVGIGGGKAIDCAKVVADQSQAIMVSVPTIVANDAPTSAIAVVNSACGQFDSIHQCRQSPSLVLVDSALIAQAPVRFLVAGMGDCIATSFEALSNHQTQGFNFVSTAYQTGYQPTLASMAIAQSCYDTIKQHGVKAKMSAEHHLCTESLEKVIEANTLLSGLGFENCGVSAAHAVYIGISTLEEAHQFYHGELVAFGVIVLMMIENYPDEEIDELLELLTQLGLPTTLEELGLAHLSSERWEEVASVINQDSTGIHASLPDVTNQLIIDNIHLASQYAQQFQAKQH